ncbi:hypothetical protein [Bacillus aerolatus]|uniref:hypothetical protein n=1 Tax=Bacillus aerolatus TaxID=2653354 RepID=UPI0017835B44|nr:hypothetical protein [Bacillus aerolatus]
MELKADFHPFDVWTEKASLWDFPELDTLGEMLVYVCENYACQQPLITLEEAREVLKKE